MDYGEIMTISPSAAEGSTMPVSNGVAKNEKVAHYISKSNLVESSVTGRAPIALCGDVWIPGRSPERYELCPDCKSTFENQKL